MRNNVRGNRIEQAKTLRKVRKPNKSRFRRVALRDLYQRAVSMYRDNDLRHLLVAPAIPVLYFGSLKDYRKSSFKVVTVGINPSSKEFEQERFDVGKSTLKNYAQLERALSNYFQKLPYEKWFNWPLEQLLQCLDASFYGKRYPTLKTPDWWRPKHNAALHTDLGSPLATKRGWSELSRRERRQLQDEGFPLWCDLIKRLSPDLLLISVSKKHLIRFVDAEWIDTDKRKGTSDAVPFRAARWRGITLIWSPASRRPFKHLSTNNLAEFASAIKQLMKRRRSFNT
jgi:hypothetical protein